MMYNEKINKIIKLGNHKYIHEKEISIIDNNCVLFLTRRVYKNDAIAFSLFLHCSVAHPLLKNTLRLRCFSSLSLPLPSAVDGSFCFACLCFALRCFFCAFYIP